MTATANAPRLPRRPAGQRELQRLETRRSLADHAIRLFQERGFDETTVEEIAAAAGVSTRTFFLHFPTKAAAAFPDHAQRVDDFVERLHAGAPHQNPVSQLRAVLLAGFDASNPTRLTRYRLLDSVPELRDEDARTDRDYEAAIRDYLVLHWGDATEARVRASAIANSVIGVVRATMSSAIEGGYDPRAVTSEILARMFGAPFDEPLGSVH